MTIQRLTVLAFVCLILALGGAIPARAQNNVPPNFFGVSTTVCTTNQVTACPQPGQAGPYPVWWPEDPINGSKPAITIGSAGKPTNFSWGTTDTDPGKLCEVPDGSTVTFHWRSWAFDQSGTTGCKNSGYGGGWDMLDSYVNAAQSGSNNPDITYTFFEVPQWAVCYDYGTSGGRMRYGGPLTINSNAVDCTPNNSIDPGAPFDQVYGLNSGSEIPCNGDVTDGKGWCAGPGYNNRFGDLTEFSMQLVDHYAGFGTAGSGNSAINDFEIWNEPDATKTNSNPGANGATIGVYWAQYLVNGNNLTPQPYWGTLISQAEALKSAISEEYQDDGLTTKSLIFIGPGIASETSKAAHNRLCGTNTSGCYLMDSTNCPSDPTKSGTMYGFLNSCGMNTSGQDVFGKDTVSIGSFHLYPSSNSSKQDTSGEGANGWTAACSNMTNETTPGSALECTGDQMVVGIQQILADFGAFSGIKGVWMTEGGWQENCDLENDCPPGTYAANYEDMRAYLARYMLIMASTVPPPSSGNLQVNREYWLGWTGSVSTATDDGTLCDWFEGGPGPTVDLPPCYTTSDGNNPSGSNSAFAGFALGQLYSTWLVEGTGTFTPQLTRCTTGGSSGPCTDSLGSIWTVAVANSNDHTEQAQWTWDGTPVTCTAANTTTGCLGPVTYSSYRTLDHMCINTQNPDGSFSYTLGEEPILLYMNSSCTP
jgi:hypothetical protein